MGLVCEEREFRAVQKFAPLGQPDVEVFLGAGQIALFGGLVPLVDRLAGGQRLGQLFDVGVHPPVLEINDVPVALDQADLPILFLDLVG